jgi:hypothetical protein
MFQDWSHHCVERTDNFVAETAIAMSVAPQHESKVHISPLSSITELSSSTSTRHDLGTDLQKQRNPFVRLH